MHRPFIDPKSNPEIALVTYSFAHTVYQTQDTSCKTWNR